MKIRAFLLDTQKALGVVAVMVPSAVGFGLLDSATAGLVTGVIGVALTGIVYALRGPTPKEPGNG